MVKFGFHVSISDSIDMAVDRARELGCDAFQIFTRNPRSWATREFGEGEPEAFRAKRAEAGIDPVYGHMPYILNLASPERGVYDRSVASLGTGLARCEALGIPMLVTHVGSHLGKGSEVGVGRVVDALDTALGADDSGVGAGFPDPRGLHFGGGGGEGVWGCWGVWGGGLPRYVSRLRGGVRVEDF